MAVGHRVDVSGHQAAAGSPAGPRGVDGAVAADGEQPAAEVIRSALEAVQVPHHLKPRFAGHVVRVIGAKNAQVAQ